MIIEFEISDGVYTLRDAIHLPDDHPFTPQDIEDMKQQRFKDFVDIITKPLEEGGI
jgi:hypothetical protein